MKRSFVVFSIFAVVLGSALSEAAAQATRVDRIESCSTAGGEIEFFKPFTTDLGIVPVPQQNNPNGAPRLVPVRYSYDQSRLEIRPLARNIFKLVVEAFEANPYPERFWLTTEETFYSGPVKIILQSGEEFNEDMRCVGVRLTHNAPPETPVSPVVPSTPAPAAGAPSGRR